ncbi:hypothetical protein PSm6_49980 [Pseudomonas solani]|uniref:DUF2848 family protein n=1 Tax=Pseudomonas solani TaxID=2731552 RepID=A0AAU7XYD2_9PSED|nr:MULTISPECIES: DUF2848 family protein [Pseudomonas]EQM71435.1 hypothetical protein L682_05880 [Pseudomonas alcaligenes OT 69]MBB4819217.1 hypothetical protein [Pseudomonas alcaligenes]MDN4145121.1 DUF2848 family protein [Pseudomonas tohonis]MDU9413215.1 DUF2848 family protein [Pseudomonas sp. zfem005]WCD83304.1 DUF2848 family protein [Pseudomonas sp. TUM22785]
MTLHFTVAGGESLAFDVRSLVVAGWTGRDADQASAQARTLSAPPPQELPRFFELSADLLSTDEDFQVPGNDSSAEVECVLFSTGTALYVGIGSDHADRRVEGYDVAVSRQLCLKPVGRELWRFHEVAGHWDQLLLRCWRHVEGRDELSQTGLVATLLDPRELIARRTGDASLPAGTAMFCGTLPFIGEPLPGEGFSVELHDPVLGRSLRHSYRVKPLA